MRVTALIATLLLVVAAPAAAFSVEFGAPAQVEGDAMLSSQGWALMLLQPGDSLVVELPADAAGARLRETYRFAGTTNDGAWTPAGRSTEPLHIETPAAKSMHFVATQPGAVLAQLTDAPTVLELTNPSLQTGTGICLGEFASEQFGASLRSWAERCDLSQEVLVSAGAGFTHEEILASSLILWGTGETCYGQGACIPDSEIHTDQHDAGPAQIIERSLFTLSFEGAPSNYGIHLPNSRPMIIGNPDVSVHIDGRARLPTFTISNCVDDGCPRGEETSTVAGQFLLSGLRADGARMEANFSGQPQSWFIDEQSADIGLLQSMAIVATVGGAAIVTIILSKLGAIGLFTRLKPDEALEHPRREALFEYIKANPGATFREIVRQTEIPTGTARHHLSVLRRSDLIVEKPHKSTLRFFENHGKYDASWDTVVMLRESALATIHEWLMAHPGSKQKDVVSAMAEGHQWSRGTTQHRLGRLAEAGLVTVRAQGRVKLYTAHESPQKPAPTNAWGGLDSSWPQPYA